jgi:hypothetical protein
MKAIAGGKLCGPRAVWSAAGALFCFAVLGTGPAHAAGTLPCAPLTHAEATDLFNRWNAALTANGVFELVGLYSDRAELAAHEADVPRRGRQAIQAYYESLLGRHPQASVISRTLEMGCNVATESGEIIYRVTGKRKGTRMLLGGRYMTQYRFENGNWRIERHLLGARPIAAHNPI